MNYGLRSIFRTVTPYMPTILILGVAVPSFLYISIMLLLGWSSPVLGAKSSLKHFNSSAATVYLYGSPTTRAHFAKIGGNYDVLLTPWRAYFAERSRSYKMINDVAELRHLKTGVLVLPSALGLSDAERSAISLYRSNGGSVLATWASGRGLPAGGI